MSNPSLPPGENPTRRRKRVRPRGGSSSPCERPSPTPKTECSSSRAENQTSPRGSLVLSTLCTNLTREDTLVTQPANSASSSSFCQTKPNPNRTTWAIPSSSRCVVCGKLTCTCQSARPDREVVRQKLESLRMNTPYERAKLLRCSEEVRRTETHRRQRCVDAWRNGFEQLQAQERTERKLVTLAQKERVRRDDIVSAEMHQRACAGFAVERYMVLSALAVHEREGRLALTATESEGRQQLRTHLQILRGLTQLSHKEACVRRTIEFNEGAERDVLFRGLVNARELSQAKVLQQIEFWKQCEDVREAVMKACAAEFDHLKALRTAHASWIGEQMQRRAVLTQSALHAAQEVSREEAAVRRGILEEMNEDADLVMERERIFARSCQNLIRTEGAARQGIVEEMMSSYHGLFLDFHSDAEEVAELEKQKARRREAEAQNAFARLQAIMQEQLDAFSQIAAREAQERALRHRWIEDKEVAKTRFVDDALAAKFAVAAAEEEARQELGRALQQSEMAALERMAQRERYCSDLWASAVAGKDDIRKAEHQGRFSLFSLMAAQEDSIRRWCEYRAKAVIDLAAAEDDARGQLYFAEETAWDTAVVAFAEGIEALERRRRDGQAALVTLTQRCEYARRTLEGEESECFASLLAFHAQEHLRATAAAGHRTQLEFQLKESQHRAWVMEEESGDRGRLITAVALAEHVLREEARHLLQARMAEVVANERAARTILVRAVEEGYHALYVQEREEQLRAVVAEEARIAAELRAREQCQTEDSRLYAVAEADERLPFDDAPCARGQSCCVGAELSDTTGSLKRQLALQALRVSDEVAGPLDAAAVDYLVAVVDGISRRRAEAGARVEGLERGAKDAARRAAQQETAYNNEKEKRDANAARLERDNADQERRLLNDKAERQRGAQQIETDRKRLHDVLSQLDRKQAELENLKVSINKQFGRP